MSNNEDEIEAVVWHEQQENILKKWGEIGSSYRFMHDRAYMYYVCYDNNTFVNKPF